MQHVDRILIYFLTAVCSVDGAVAHFSESRWSSNNDNVYYGADTEDSGGKLPSAKLHFLELIDLGLDKWGSKIAMSRKAGNVTGWNGTQFLKERLDDVPPTRLARVELLARQNSSRFFVVFAVCVFVLLCLAGIMYLFENETYGADGLGDKQDSAHFIASQFVEDHETDSYVQAKIQKRRNSAAGQAGAPIAEADGSWVRAYREATGSRKEALQLLFECQIISNSEFLNSRVSPEHIEECVWIGNVMLRQKTLEQWRELHWQANEVFADKVAEVFTAKKSSSPPFALPRGEDSYPGIDADDPYSTRGNPASFSSPPQQFYSPEAKDRGRSEKALGEGEYPDRGLSPIISRCLAIQSAPPQEGVPVQSPSVVRSASNATTIAAVGAASRQSSVAQMPPSSLSREPGETMEGLQQLEGYRQIDRWPPPEQGSSSRASDEYDDRTFVQTLDTRPGTPPIVVFPTSPSPQTVASGPPAQQPGRSRAQSGDTPPVHVPIRLDPTMTFGGDTPPAHVPIRLDPLPPRQPQAEAQNYREAQHYSRNAS